MNNEAALAAHKRYVIMNSSSLKTVMKSVLTLVVVLVLATAFCACTAPSGNDPTAAPADATPVSGGDPESGTDEDPSAIPQVVASEQFTKFDTTIAYVPDECTKIVLAQNATEVTGQGATVDSNVVTINTAGSYIISGTLTDGQIVVNVEKTEKVRLILSGVNITNTKTACIYVMSADKVGITLVKGTENVFTDAKTYTVIDEKNNPNACIFSKDDLTINGYGSLTVNGNFNNGIGCKNDLCIVTGNVTVSAPNNAVKATDSFRMHDGYLKVTSQDDAIKVDGEDDISKGFVFIEGGTLELTAVDDAITAVYSVNITGGTVTTYAEGKAINCAGNVTVAEGSLIEK